MPSTKNNLPLVSIGIPTFNRSLALQRAINSTMTQDYANIEVIIYDNASTDDTEIVCRELVKLNASIKYYRQHINVGPTKNFSDLLYESTGEFFMWLADDDYIDKNYVASCVDFLIRHTDYVCVGGRAKFIQNGQINSVGHLFNIKQNNKTLRILSYYWGPFDNSIFYGVMRRNEAIKNRLQNCIGGDWLFSAGMAWQGKLLTIEQSTIYRDIGGTSSSHRGLIKTLGLPLIQARFPYLSISYNAFLDVLIRNPVYAANSKATRLINSVMILFTLLLRHSIIHNFKKIRFMVLTTLLGLDRYDAIKRYLKSGRKA